MSKALRIAALACLAAGCARGVDVRPDARVAVAASPSPQVEQGTLLTAQLRQPLSTDTSRKGDRFTAELLDPLVDGQGDVVVPSGAIVEGLVARASPSRVAGSQAQLQLDITGLRLQGTEALPVSLEVADASTELEATWPMGVFGAIAGAAAGAGTGLLVDDGRTSTMVGATLLGLGVGAVIAFVAAPRDASIPSGGLLTLRLSEPLPTQAGLALQEKQRSRRSNEPVREGEERRATEED